MAIVSWWRSVLAVISASLIYFAQNPPFKSNVAGAV
jgi:hypothetical protein